METNPPQLSPAARALPSVAGLLSFSAGPVGLVVQRYLVESLAPPLIIAVQMSIGVVALWLIRLAFPRAHLPLSAYLKGLALGFVQPGILMMLLTTAGSRLDSVTFVLMTALFPGMVALLGRILLKEALSRWVVVGLFVSFAGMIVVVFARDTTGENQVLGFALVALALIVGPAGIIAGRVINTTAIMPWYVLAPLQVSGAWLAACLAAGVLVFGYGATVPDSLSSSQWMAFAYLGLIMTALSFMTFNYALSRLTVVHIGLLAAAGPAAGTLAAAVIFRQVLGPLALLGIAVVLFGAALPAVRAILAR